MEINKETAFLKDKQRKKMMKASKVINNYRDAYYINKSNLPSRLWEKRTHTSSIIKKCINRNIINDKSSPEMV